VPESLDKLKRENLRLIELLERHGIEWRESADPTRTVQTKVDQSQLSTEAKIHLYQTLFRGRSDVYAQRWENAKGDRSGYSPACSNEWRSGICEKPRIKCGDCQYRQLIPLDDTIVYEHLAGKLTAGIYPLMDNNTCFFLAIDFDKSDWRNDVRSFAATQLKSRVRERGPMHGFFSIKLFRRVMQGNSEPCSSVTPVRGISSLICRLTIACFRIRTFCQKAGLAI